MWALRRHVPKHVFCGFAVASKKMVSKMCSAQRLRRRRVLGTSVLEHVFQTCPVARTRLSDASRGQNTSFTRSRGQNTSFRCVAWPEHVFRVHPFIQNTSSRHGHTPRTHRQDARTRLWNVFPCAEHILFGRTHLHAKGEHIPNTSFSSTRWGVRTHLQNVFLRVGRSSAHRPGER